jgi:hypothetical protein
MHGYMGRLRRLLGGGPGGPLVHRDGGYELIVDNGDLDTHVFEGLVAHARRAMMAGRFGLAVSRSTQALGLWRGPALADVEPTPAVMVEAARLEQIRLEAAELRVQAWLRLGLRADVATDRPTRGRAVC